MTTKTYTLELTDNEIEVLRYLVGGAASPYASDPLKDVYEMGMKSDDAYEALESLDLKISKL
jgi:hypothetical protein